MEPTFVLHTGSSPAADGVEGELEQRAGKSLLRRHSDDAMPARYISRTRLSWWETGPGWASTAPAAEPSAGMCKQERVQWTPYITRTY